MTDSSRLIHDFEVRGWTERSPAETGFYRGDRGKPVTDCRFKPQNSKIKEIEVYDRDRYFTVTGHGRRLR